LKTCNGNSDTALKIIRFVEKELGKKAKTKFVFRNKASILKTYANIKKAQTLLKWEPRVDFRTGLKKTIDWHLKNQRIWRQHLKGATFSIGTRIHGSIMSLLCGVPTLCMCIDSRTTELWLGFLTKRYKNYDN